MTFKEFKRITNNNALVMNGIGDLHDFLLATSEMLNEVIDEKWWIDALEYTYKVEDSIDNILMKKYKNRRAYISAKAHMMESIYRKRWF